ncbi:MAG: LrgB family protein [Eubacteriales bacterium]|nr:LrgB family protein [Eubacteriales bacterium]
MTSSFFYIALTLAAYALALKASKRLKHPLANPLFWSAVIVIILIYLLPVSFEDYFSSMTIFDMLLLLSTVSLAVPLYKNLDSLKKNALPILGGVLVGIVVSAGTIILFTKLLGIDKDLIIALLPKSITLGMSLPLIEEVGGYSAITAFSVIITGTSGAVFGPSILRAIRVDDPIAVGVALGTTSHVSGTAVAYEMGEVEGSIASLCIAITGLITIMLFPLILMILDALP